MVAIEAAATAADCRMLLHLTEAEAQPVREEALRWVRTALGNSPQFEVAWVLELLDGRHDDVRRVGWEWFAGEQRAWQDITVWQRQLESPYDDIRLKLVTMLEDQVGRHAGCAAARRQCSA